MYCKGHPPTYHELAISFYEMDNSCMLKLKASSPLGDSRFLRVFKGFFTLDHEKPILRVVTSAIQSYLRCALDQRIFSV